MRWRLGLRANAYTFSVCALTFPCFVCCLDQAPAVEKAIEALLYDFVLDYGLVDFRLCCDAEWHLLTPALTARAQMLVMAALELTLFKEGKGRDGGNSKELFKAGQEALTHMGKELNVRAEQIYAELNQRRAVLCDEAGEAFSSLAQTYRATKQDFRVPFVAFNSEDGALKVTACPTSQQRLAVNDVGETEIRFNESRDSVSCTHYAHFAQNMRGSLHFMCYPHTLRALCSESVQTNPFLIGSEVTWDVFSQFLECIASRYMRLHDVAHLSTRFPRHPSDGTVASYTKEVSRLREQRALHRAMYWKCVNDVFLDPDHKPADGEAQKTKQKFDRPHLCFDAGFQEQWVAGAFKDKVAQNDLRGPDEPCQTTFLLRKTLAQSVRAKQGVLHIEKFPSYLLDEIEIPVSPHRAQIPRKMHALCVMPRILCSLHILCVHACRRGTLRHDLWFVCWRK